MPVKKTLSLDDVFEKDLQNEGFLKKERLRKPYEDLLVDIINRRVELGLTQKDLAEKAKTFQSRISKIESGEHDFRLSTIIQIAEALNSELIVRLMPFETKRAEEFSDKAINKLFEPDETVEPLFDQTTAKWHELVYFTSSSQNKVRPIISQGTTLFIAYKRESELTAHNSETSAAEV